MVDTITPLPSGPSRNDDPTNFVVKSDAWVAALVTWTTQTNTLAVDIETIANDATTATAADVVAAANSATASSGFADASAASSSSSSGFADASQTSSNSSSGFADASAASSVTASGFADAAEDTYDRFDDRYLGEKSGDPGTDNDGDPLVTGALYFNNSINEMKVYNGATWQVAAGTINPDFVVIREAFTATAGQTVFALATSYAVGLNLMMVYINGLRLSVEDYVETNSSTITFNAGTTVGDEVLFEHGVTVIGGTTSAALTSFAPIGNLVGVTVQDALAELDASITTQLTAQNATVTTQLSDQDTAVTGQLSTQDTAVANQLSAQDAAVTAQLAEMIDIEEAHAIALSL